MKDELDELMGSASATADAISTLQDASTEIAGIVSANAEAAKASSASAALKLAKLSTTVGDLVSEVADIADQVADIGGGGGGGNRVPFVVAAAHEGAGAVDAITVGDEQAIINVVGENLIRGVSVSLCALRCICLKSTRIVELIMICGRLIWWRSMIQQSIFASTM